MNNGNDELVGQIVPFGRYKGRPVAELAADDSYRDYMMAQPWFKDRWPDIYNILVHGGPPPQHSPEHNEMQARFLDDSWCLGLMRTCNDLADDGLGIAGKKALAWQKKNKGINPDIADQYKINQAKTSDILFEDHGWDVTFTYSPASISQWWACRCGIQPDKEWQDKGKNTFYYSSADECWEKDYWKPCELIRISSPEPVEPSLPVREDYKDPSGVAGYPYQPYPAYGRSAQQRYEQALTRYQQDLISYRIKLAEYPEKQAQEEAQYRVALAGHEEKMVRYREQRHYALDHRDHENLFTRDGTPRLIAAELKPDLGDDYPAVLRQIQKYMTVRRNYGRGQYGDEPTCHAAFLVVRRAQFRSVTWDQVVKIFARSGIQMVPESRLAGPS